MSNKDALKGFAKGFSSGVIGILTLVYGGKAATSWAFQTSNLWETAKAVGLIFVILTICIATVSSLPITKEIIRKLVPTEAESVGASCGTISGILFGCFMLYILK
ncbi:hypothetical protein Bb109J_c1093 [Bdellovibrio bacteriovorus]|nr:hypothetical protein EP01_16035 [Bdellovibrio bacteriovorus]BEV67673.1 hypothetical protein Bb109J_c1093 [Bdellovibrio bacteriovorus]